jgi:hypothetical protein
VRTSHLVGLLVGLASTSCDSPTEFVLGSTYVMRSIAGDPLPAPWAPNDAVTGRMLGSSVLLTDDGKGRYLATYEHDGGQTFQQNSELTYTRDGADIAITFTCPPDALCIAGPHLVGRILEDGLRITTSNVIRTPVMFDRGVAR